MAINIEELQAIDGGIWLNLTEEELLKVEASPEIYSNQTGCNNARLSQLCLNKFSHWLRENEQPYQLTFNQEELITIWDVVVGLAIDVGKFRLILIPSENIDREEFLVPQEWVDLPNWVGDYYLAVNIDIEARLMNIWGMIDHRSLKEKGEYQRFDRCYSILGDLLVSNLDFITIPEVLEIGDRSPTISLPTLSLDQAITSIQNLAISTDYSPRLKVEFNQWGAILNSPNLRSQLYQARLQRSLINQTSIPTFRLRDWLDNTIINTISSRWQFYQPTLTTRNISNQIEAAKLINLQVNLGQETVILLVGIIPRENSQIKIIVQVHPDESAIYLPNQLQLSYLDSTGITLRNVTTRLHDNYIQLPSFTCSLGTEFNIQIQLNSHRYLERFTV